METTWVEILKGKLEGRMLVTCEMNVYFRGTIDRVEVSGNTLRIYVKAWFRMYDKWEPWKDEEVPPKAILVPISGKHAVTPEINTETGETSFYLMFKGDIWIRYHDCELQDNEYPSLFDGGIAFSDLRYNDVEGWHIRTSVNFYDGQQRDIFFSTPVTHCPACGEKLPSFK